MILTKSQRAGVKAYKTKLLMAVAQNADEIVQLSNDIKEREDDWEYQCDRESIICKSIGPTTWSSFCRFGDRNQATEALILKWIRNDGEPLDIQAMWIESDYGISIAPSELAQFMIDHDRGAHEFYYHRQTEELKSIFKELTGFNWSFHAHKIIASQYSTE